MISQLAALLHNGRPFIALSIARTTTSAATAAATSTSTTTSTTTKNLTKNLKTIPPTATQHPSLRALTKRPHRIKPDHYDSDVFMQFAIATSASQLVIRHVVSQSLSVITTCTKYNKHVCTMMQAPRPEQSRWAGPALESL
jgi:hypothetical protein